MTRAPYGSGSGLAAVSVYVIESPGCTSLPDAGSALAVTLSSEGTDADDATPAHIGKPAATKTTTASASVTLLNLGWTPHAPARRPPEPDIQPLRSDAREIAMGAEPGPLLVPTHHVDEPACRFPGCQLRPEIPSRNLCNNTSQSDTIVVGSAALGDPSVTVRKERGLRPIVALFIRRLRRIGRDGAVVATAMMRADGWFLLLTPRDLEALGVMAQGTAGNRLSAGILPIPGGAGRVERAVPAGRVRAYIQSQLTSR